MALLALAGLLPSSHGFIPDAHEPYLRIDGAGSVAFLGSEDARQGTILGLEWTWKDPAVSRRLGNNTFISFSIYGISHRSRIGQYNDKSTVGIGALYSVRWLSKVSRGHQLYAQAGWGLNLADRTSVDLDSKINSTPAARLGVLFDFGGQRLDLGIGLLHFSNAGLVGNNQGQTFFTISLGSRV